MGPGNKLIDLRKLLAERFPRPSSPPTSVLPTGVEFLDQITAGGGLPKSAITELITPKTSAGSASLIHALLCSARRDRRFIALIDGTDSFDPGSSDKAALQHLLWVRCRKAFDAIKAADLLLRDGNFPLVIVDLVLNSLEELRKIPQTSWYRLQRLVEAVSTACLIINRHGIVASSQLKLVLENSWMLPDLENENAISNLRFRVQRFARANFTTGAVFGRKLYDGRSQPQVVDLGKSATCLGKVCVRSPRRPNRSREAGDSVLAKTERSHLKSLVTRHLSLVT